MKKALIVLVTVLVVLTGAVFVGPSFIDWNNFKDTARNQISRYTGYEVDFEGNIGFSVLPAPFIYVEKVKILPPASYQGQRFAELERMDVNIALLPLFAGKVIVDSLTFVKPLITIEMTSSGTFAGMTPQIQAMIEGSEAAEAQSLGELSLNHISVVDGQITYLSHNGEQSFTANSIAATFNAPKLNGPYKAEGSLQYNGLDASFTVLTGVLSPEKNTSLNLQAALSGAAEIRYDGVLDYAKGIELQGETNVTITSYEALAGLGGPTLGVSQPLSVRGLLTLSSQEMSLQSAGLSIGGQEFQGKVLASRIPPDIKAQFSAAQPVNLNDLLSHGKTRAAGSDPSSAGIFSLLPETLSLPYDFSCLIEFSAPAALYRTQSLKEVQFNISKQEKTFKTEIKVTEMPGQGSLSLLTDLSFSAQSVSEKTGGVVFSDPLLTADINLKTQNLAQTLDLLGGSTAYGLPDHLKSAEIQASAEVRPNEIQVKAGNFKIEDMSATFSGSYKPGTAGRDKLAADLALDKFDSERIFASQTAPDQQSTFADTLKTLSLPFDLGFDIGVQTFKSGNQEIEGLRAQGVLSENALQFTNLSAQNYAGLAVKLDGGMADLKNLAGIDVNIAGESADVKSVMQHFEFDASALPQNLSSAYVNVSAKGDANALQVRAQIRALEADMVAAGRLITPLTAIKTEGLNFQIKHPNLANFIQSLYPDTDYYQELSKPFDFYADVQVDGQKTSFSNIKTALSGTPITGYLNYDGSASRPYFKAALDIGDLVLRPVQQTSGQLQRIPAKSIGRGTDGAAKWSSDPINSAWLHAMDADLDVKAKSFVYDPWALAYVSAAMSLKDGTLNIAGLKADVLRGQMSADATFSSAEQGAGPLRLSGKAQFQNVSIEDLMGNLIGTKIIRGQGLANFNADISAAGISQAALVSNLNGTASSSGQNIVLEGLDLSRFAQALSAETKPGDTLLGLWQGSVSGGSTAFQTLDGVFDIKQGVIGIQKLDLLGPQANIRTTGAVNLPRWTVQTAHTIALPAPQGATEVPPPFTVNISGPLDNPAQTFGQGAIQDYLTRKINRKLEKIITDKIGEEFGFPGELIAPEPSGGETPADGSQQQQQQTPEKAFEGLLKGLIR